MKQFKLLLSAACLLLATGMQAQTDVTSTYVANADFSSIDGWTSVVSAQYVAIGNGLIGTFNNYEGVATVDDTHLSTEYCIGLECRWSTNFASYTQTTVELPSGVYTLTFDVENVNSGTSKASYENRFFVQIGDNKITDSAKEWMNAKSSWTTHSITFTLDEPAAATISLGYGTGSNNIGSGGTPRLYVSHLKLTYTDLLAGLKTQLASVQATATELLENPDYDIVTGEVRTTLQTLSTATAASETAEAYEALIEQVKDAIAAFEAAKPLAENTAAVAGASKDNPVVTNFVVNGTFSSNTTGWSSTGGFQNRGTATNQSGDFTTPYWENWDRQGDQQHPQRYLRTEDCRIREQTCYS